MKRPVLIMLFICAALSGFAQNVIPLYNGQRPAGSEMLTFPEKVQKTNFARIDSVNGPFVPLAVADGLEAVKYVRQHATEYGIDPLRIGMMGFSAGGTVTGSVAQTYNAESRPDFVAPIYAYCPAMLGDKVPADAPPMFLALASDDPIAYANTRFYEKWRDAAKPVEMHIYGKGGHGFGIQKRGMPTDDWTLRFEEWLSGQGFLKSKSSK